VIGPSQRPLPDNTQYSRQTDRQTSMPPRGIWNLYPSKGAAADPRLGLRSHWDRHSFAQNLVILSVFCGGRWPSRGSQSGRMVQSLVRTL